MKSKKILSGVLASAMLIMSAQALPSIAVTYDNDPTGNTMLSADEVTFGEVTSGNIGYYDNDWYKFTVPSTGMISVTIGADTLADYKMIGGDAEGTSYDSSTFGSGTQVHTYYLTAGDYYIHLSYRGSSDKPDYDLMVKFTPYDLTFDGADNNILFNAAPVEYDGTVYKGALLNNDTVDYYTFNVAEQGRVTLQFTSSMQDVDWEIYDSEDSKIKTGSFSKGSQEKYISGKDANIMKPGKYTIAIKKKDSYGDYSFSLDYLQNYNDISVSGIIAAADLNEDGSIDSSDASLILAYYSYLQTGGTETDMNKWLANK